MQQSTVFDQQTNTLQLGTNHKGPYRIVVENTIDTDYDFMATMTVDALERIEAQGECEAHMVVEMIGGRRITWGYNARQRMIFDDSGNAKTATRSGLDCDAPVEVGLRKVGSALFLESGGRLERFVQLNRESHIQRVFVEIVNHNSVGCRVQVSGITLQNTLPQKDEATFKLVRPIEKCVMMNVLGWLPSEKFSAHFAKDAFDFPILSVQDGLVGQVNTLGDHGVDVVLLDFLGAKRPSMVGVQFDMQDNWLNAIRQSRYPQMRFAPFWEYDTGGANPYHGKVGIGSDDLDSAADFVATIMAYHANRYRDDKELYRLQGRPVDFLYNSMIFNKPSFWADVTDRIHAMIGRSPILSLGPGGLPMTLNAEFDPEFFHAFTDRYFDSVFVFNLWGPTADVFPGKIIDHYRNRDKTVQVVGTAVPGYWSVRHNMQSIVPARFTERLRESLSGSLAADVDGIHVTTWNDFWENTQFCPSFSFLDSRLEILQALTAPWKDITEPAITDCPRAILSYNKVAYPGETLDMELYVLPGADGIDASITAKLEVTDTVTNNIIFTGDIGPVAPGKALRLSEAHDRITVLSDAPSSLAIRVTLTCNGRNNTISNMPQIAVLPTEFLKRDLLYYSIPLHHMASTQRQAELNINGQTSRIVQADGLCAYRLEDVTEPGIDFAVMCNSRSVRLMAPLTQAGAEYFPGRASNIELVPNAYEYFLDSSSDQGAHASVPAIQNPAKARTHYPLRTGGWSYYAALVRYPDGKYAYTPTVWVKQGMAHGPQLVGSYVFDDIQNGLLLDRSPYLRDIPWEPKAKSNMTMLRPDLPVIKWDDKSPLINLPIDFIPSTAASLECVFRIDEASGELPLLAQAGNSKQLDLRVDASRRLVLTRQSDVNKPIAITSPPLQTDHVYHAVAVFNGTQLTLYLDGKPVGSVPCQGGRTSEGTWLGSFGNARFCGVILRMNVYNGALNQQQVTAMVGLLRLLNLP
jgi:hypothetical protein